MSLLRTTRLFWIVAALLAPGPALAQSLGSRPVTIVVPFAAGGSTDLLGRAVADQLAKSLGNPVIVVNKPGAGTVLAAESVAKAAPDGHTLLLASTSTLVFNPLLNPNLRYDAERDFIGVSMLAAAPVVMVVNAKSAANSVDELIALARATPKKLNFGSPGMGSSLHLAAELFMSMAKVDMVHVPYKGSQPALMGLLGDEIQVYFDLIATSKPLIDSGQLRALAVTSRSRLEALPSVPTFAELGFVGYDVSPRFALVAPAGTPPAVIQRLNTEVVRALDTPRLKSRFAAVAMELSPSAPEAVNAFFAAERAAWAPLIKAKGIRLDP